MAISFWALFIREIHKGQHQLGKSKLSHHTFSEHFWNLFGYTEIKPEKRPDEQTAPTAMVSILVYIQDASLGLLLSCPSLMSQFPSLLYSWPPRLLSSISLIWLHLPTWRGICTVRLWQKRKTPGKSYARSQKNGCYLLCLYFSSIEAVWKVIFAVPSFLMYWPSPTCKVGRVICEQQ